MNQRIMVIVIFGTILLCYIRRNVQLIDAFANNQVALRLIHVIPMQSFQSIFQYQNNSTPVDSIQSEFSIDTLSPKSTSGFRIRGIASILANHDFVMAEKSLQVAIAHQPDDKISRYWLGMTQYLQGKEDLAVVQWQQVNASLLLVEIGRFLREQNHSEESLQWYQMAIRISPETGEEYSENVGLGLAYRELALIAREQGRINDAIKYLEQAVAYLPGRTDFRYDLAVLYTGQSRYEEAIDQVQASLRIQPGSVTWLGALGEIHLQAGRLDEAEQAFWLSLNSGSISNGQDRYWYARDWFGLSLVYYQRQAWEECVNASFQAVEIRHAMDGAWKDQFSRNFQAALDAEPDRLDWYIAIGRMYEEFGEPATALKYYNQAAQRWPDNLLLLTAIQRVSNVTSKNPENDQILIPTK